ncbi:winged helix-turn-helix transcriptional regulator [Actinoplanes sp. NPDC051411]|uniref:winged helix-turn-helix transcriptional regulator n=1 Tax=Actinoplanes sp. NPDC051411 TaxID=3155522 RepID=UPI003436510C
MLELLRDIHRRKFGQSVLDALADGSKRYVEIARTIGEDGKYVHAQTLASTLDYLRNGLGVIEKRRCAHHDEYALTSIGRQLLRATQVIGAVETRPEP